jgi:integrase
MAGGMDSSQPTTRPAGREQLVGHPGAGAPPPEASPRRGRTDLASDSAGVVAGIDAQEHGLRHDGRQDAPDLPRVPVEKRTTGRTFTGRDGTVYRPSTFLTVTCDSYGRVNSDGTPVDPTRYDYRRAARDGLHFAKAVDRLLQNLRRVVGYDVQYFACVEPQKRLAPHLHAALRGTLPQAVLRQVVAATYHHAQGKDAARPVAARRCCAVGKCCGAVPSGYVVQIARDVLRSALGTAVTEELVARNVAALVKVPAPRRSQRKPWSADESRRFLDAARSASDPLFAAYVLVLVLGLRRGEVLRLSWEDVDLDGGELQVSRQLQRVHVQLVHGGTETEGSAAGLPLPDICVTALRLRHRHRHRQQAVDQLAAGEAWQGHGLVFTTRYGRPVEPRNFNRSFEARCQASGTRRIRVHDTRHTCASLLAEMDVHPRVAMQILRHSRVAMTLDVYSKVSSKATRDALKRLGSILDT